MRNLLFIVGVLVSAAVFAQSKEQIAGTWKADGAEYTFAADGTCKRTVADRECPGTWIIKNNTLTINPKTLMWRKDDPCSKTTVFELASLKGGKLTLRDTVEKKVIYLVKE